MTLVYRAAWTDDSHLPTAVLHDEFRNWCRSKNIDEIDIPHRGTITGPHGEIDVRRGDTESGKVYRARLTERDHLQRTWTTMATALNTPTFRGYWVDVECEDPEQDRPIPIAAPRLVRNILAEDGTPVRGPVPIAATHSVLLADAAVDSLLGLLRNHTRDLPLVVFSPDMRLGPAANDERAQRTAEALAGLAHVYLLSPASSDRFNDAIPTDMAVYGGAVRAYLPGFSDDDDQFRHRYWSMLSIRSGTRRAGELIARHLSRVQAWPTPPAAYDQVRALISRPTDKEFEERKAGLIHALPTSVDPANLSEHDDLLELLVNAERERDQFRDELSYETEILRAANSSLQSDFLDAEVAIEALVEENIALLKNLRIIHYNRNVESDVNEENWRLIEAPQRPSEAVELAQEKLRHVVVHDKATQQVERLDESIKNSVWAAHTWQGLCALQEYAENIHSGEATDGLYLWCKETNAWPSNKLAMNESDKVIQDRRLRKHRMLPVDMDVDPSGSIEMLAHLQVQRSGGSDIPRLYFHDDTRGPTGAFHIGFYGPHGLMPNTMS